MYTPEQVAESNQCEVDYILSNFPLATVVASTENGLVANHIPLLRQGQDRFLGHLGANSNLRRLIDSGQEVLAVFSGAEHCIDPNCCSSKSEIHGDDPSWSYHAVHVYGQLYSSVQPRDKLRIVGLLTNHHEACASPERTWSMHDAPKDVVSDLLDVIVVFEMRISRIVAKPKFSQDNDPSECAGTVAGLRAQNEDELVASMFRHQP